MTPWPLRAGFSLGANARVALVPDEDGIRLRVPRREATFAGKDGVLVHLAEAAAPISVMEPAQTNGYAQKQGETD